LLGTLVIASGTGTSLAMGAAAVPAVHSEGKMPPLTGASRWLNSPALTPGSLRGKVVLVDFWTYSCINCLRAMPYVRAWHERYKDHGLVVIGVHAPEFEFEKSADNVRRAIADLKINYPVALDNDYAIWEAFGNQVWPAHYFIDAEGRIRRHHYGEGEYDESEQTLRQLLTEAGNLNLPAPVSKKLKATGVEAAADDAHQASPETYVGYQRAENFVSPGGYLHDRPKLYATPEQLRRNQWGLTGEWTARKDVAVLGAAPGSITFRFLARDLHLVLGPGAKGKSIRYRVRIDGAPPARDRGVDVDAQGNGVIREQRLYQLIRQSGEVTERTFTIEFLDGGVEAYSFTFG